MKGLLLVGALAVLSGSVFADTIIIVNDQSSVRGEVVGIDHVTEAGEAGFQRTSARSLLMSKETYAAKLVAKKYTRITTQHTELQSTPVVVTDCSTDPGDGKGDWHGFYNVGGIEAKARALDNAILGVGPKLSYPLVKYFDGQRKPRTWKEFSDRINMADEEIGHGLAANVLSKYGRENAANLGYYDSAICTQSIAYVNLPVQIQDTYKILDEVKTKQVQVSFDPQDSRDPRSTILLPGEEETVSVSFDGRSVSAYVTNARSEYEAVIDNAGSVVNVELRSNGRKLSSAQSLNQVSVGFEKDSANNIVLVVTNNLVDYDTVLKPQMKIDLKFMKESFGLDQQIAGRAYNLNSALRVQRIRTDVKFDYKKRVYGKYSVTRYADETGHYRSSPSEANSTSHYR